MGLNLFGLVFVCLCVQFNLVGMGGRYSLDYPRSVDLGECPRGQWHEHRFVVTNNGDVSAQLAFGVDIGASATATATATASASISADTKTDEKSRGTTSAAAAAPAATAYVPIGSTRPKTAEAATGGGVSSFLPTTAPRLFSAAQSGASAAVDGGDETASSPAESVLTVRTVPANKTLAAGARVSVAVRVFVPARVQRTPFSFTVVLKSAEAVHRLSFRGVVSVIEVSQYALTLLAQYKPSIDRLLAVPHALDSVAPALLRDRITQIERVQQKEREFRWKRTRTFVHTYGIPRSPAEVTAFQDFLNRRTDRFDEFEDSDTIVQSTLHSMVKAVEHVQHALSLATSHAQATATATATGLSVPTDREARHQQRQLLAEQLLSSYGRHQARVFNPLTTAKTTKTAKSSKSVITAVPVSVPVPALVNPLLVDCNRQTVSQVPVALLSFPPPRLPPPGLGDTKKTHKPKSSSISFAIELDGAGAGAGATATESTNAESAAEYEYAVVTGLNLNGEYSHVTTHGAYRGLLGASTLRDDVLDVILSAEPKLPNPTYDHILRYVEPTLETSATASILDQLRRDPPPVLHPNPPYL